MNCSIATFNSAALLHGKTSNLTSTTSSTNFFFLLDKPSYDCFLFDSLSFNNWEIVLQCLMIDLESVWDVFTEVDSYTNTIPCAPCIPPSYRAFIARCCLALTSSYALNITNEACLKSSPFVVATMRSVGEVKASPSKLINNIRFLSDTSTGRTHAVLNKLDAVDLMTLLL